MQAQLNQDVLIHIAEQLAEEGDFSALYRCSLVNKAFNYVASKFLYHEIVLAPAYTNVFRLGKHNQELTKAWTSALLPSNAAFVSSLRVMGFLLERSAPQNNFSEVLRDSVLAWRNLNSVTFAPIQSHEDVFTEALSALSQCQQLRRLNVGPSCCDEKRTAVLVKLEGLESLTIQSPTRLILNDLPEWLSRLQPTLRTFHLTDNCGSVTPGVLKSFLPHIGSISSFALGLSYSVTDKDAVAFFEQLPQLSKLDFRYYLQLRPPAVTPPLHALRSLTVRHTQINQRSDADHLMRWMRRISSRSPLERLELKLDQWTVSPGPAVGFDGLFHHLAAKHATTLRELCLLHVFVGLDTLIKTCAQLKCLETLAVGTAPGVATRLQEVFSPCRSLRTLSIRTPQKAAKKVLRDTASVTTFMRSMPNLRRFSLNNTHWEGSWVSDPSGEVIFDVHEIPTMVILPPNQG